MLSIYARRFRWCPEFASLCEHLRLIVNKVSPEDLLQVTLWKKAINAEHQVLLDIFEEFTFLEQAVLRILLLNLGNTTLEELASIIKIDTVRLHHVITIIQENKVWESIKWP